MTMPPADEMAVSVCWLYHECPPVPGDRRYRATGLQPFTALGHLDVRLSRELHPRDCRFCPKSQEERTALVREAFAHRKDPAVAEFYALPDRVRWVRFREAQEGSWIDQLIGDDEP